MCLRCCQTVSTIVNRYSLSFACYIVLRIVLKYASEGSDDLTASNNLRRTT